MTSSGLKIRIVRAKREDLPRVLELMRGLAEFEKLLDEFRVTEALLERYLFNRDPVAELLVGCIGEEIHGYALFFHNFSSFQGRQGIFLEDVYVEPPSRGKGLGKALFVEVMRIARARECRRSEWVVLDWNQRAKKFYESLGAKILSDWRLCRMDEAAMHRLVSGDCEEDNEPAGGDG
ncbi:MAG: GNAT family N-acetyltransferase [Deltaproteobacteria bacterium]|nr:GNAT family N-acetyltransferase [Deltaproteobacteria bacterium]